MSNFLSTFLIQALSLIPSQFFNSQSKRILHLNFFKYNLFFLSDREHESLSVGVKIVRFRNSLDHRARDYSKEKLGLPKPNCSEENSTAHCQKSTRLLNFLRKIYDCQLLKVGTYTHQLLHKCTTRN